MKLFEHPGPRPAPVFGPFHAFVDEILAADATAPWKQRHTAAQIHRRLVAEKGTPESTIRFVATCSRSVSIAARRSFLWSTGRARAEADFGHIHVDFPDGRRQVPILIVTWSWVIDFAELNEHFRRCCLAERERTHAAIALGRALCQIGKRVRFITAAKLVTLLEAAQQQHRLDRLLATLDRFDLLAVDELGYLSFSRAGAELLFQVFADRYERRSLLITSNLPFGEWGQVFPGDRMTAALLDRLTHRCHIFEMNGESYRFHESMKTKKEKDARKGK